MNNYFDRLIKLSGLAQPEHSSLNHSQIKYMVTDKDDTIPNILGIKHENDMPENESLNSKIPKESKIGADSWTSVGEKKELDVDGRINLYQGDQSRITRNNSAIGEKEDQSNLIPNSASSGTNIIKEVYANHYLSIKKQPENEIVSDREGIIQDHVPLNELQLEEGRRNTDRHSKSVSSTAFSFEGLEKMNIDNIDFKDQIENLSSIKGFSNIINDNENEIYDSDFEGAPKSLENIVALGNSHAEKPQTNDIINVTIGSIFLKISTDTQKENLTKQTPIKSNSERIDNSNTGSLRRYYVRSRLR